MRTGAAHDHEGYFHETAFYGSDAEFADIVVPFLAEGVAAGEPTIAALNPANTAVVLDALGPVEGLTLMAGLDEYNRPAVTIRTLQQVLAERLAAGAGQVRIVGDVPHPGTGAPWEGWARYEAAVNHAYGAVPLWGLCPYDLRTTPAAVLADVERTHPFVATTGGGHRPNDRYERPEDFLRRRLHDGDAADPVEATPPAVELVGPTASAARRAVAELAANVPIPGVQVDDLVVAVSETVTNAALYGEPPVRLRLWIAGDRLVATVSDRGPGPSDPFVGMLPSRSRGDLGGRGLWITHQVCDHVAMRAQRDGFTVRLVAGQPPPTL